VAESRRVAERRARLTGGRVRAPRGNPEPRPTGHASSRRQARRAGKDAARASSLPPFSGSGVKLPVAVWRAGTRLCVQPRLSPPFDPLRKSLTIGGSSLGQRLYTPAQRGSSAAQRSSFGSGACGVGAAGFAWQSQACPLAFGGGRAQPTGAPSLQSTASVPSTGVQWTVWTEWTAWTVEPGAHHAMATSLSRLRVVPGGGEESSLAAGRGRAARPQAIEASFSR